MAGKEIDPRIVEKVVEERRKHEDALGKKLSADKLKRDQKAGRDAFNRPIDVKKRQGRRRG